MDPWTCSPPGSSVHGIFQVRSRLSFPSLGDLPYPELEPESLALANGFFTIETLGLKNTLCFRLNHHNPAILYDELTHGLHTFFS